MDDDAVKNFIPFRVSAEEPLFEVGCIQSVVFGDFIAVRVDPFSTVDAGRDRIVFAMIMQLYPLDADRLVEAGNLYLRRVVRASRPLADREAIAAPLHLFRDGGPLIVVASAGVQFTAGCELLLEAGRLAFPAMRRREYPRQGDDDFLLFHFCVLIFFVRHRQETRTGFCFEVITCPRERGGRQFALFPFAEEIVPPALVAQQT